MKITRCLPALLATSLVAGTTACNIGAIFPPAHLDYIAVFGDTVVAVGDTIRLSAEGTRGIFFGTADALPDALWESMDPRIATVTTLRRTRADSLSSPALVKGVSVGQVVIQVSARGVTATHLVSVQPPSFPRTGSLSESR